MKLKETLRTQSSELDPYTATFQQDLAQRFNVDVQLINKLRFAGEPRKLIFMWIKQGHINYKTFEKLWAFVQGERR